MELMPIVIPLLIFLARIIDVSLGTIRIICISRGIRLLAALLGFIEILIWLMAISQIFHNLTNVANYIAYAAGFGMGTFVGISIERKLSMGNLMIRVITKKDAVDLIKTLISHRYGVTTLDAQGATGAVKVLYIIARRKNLEKVISIIKEFNPKAFYTIEDIRFATEQNLFPITAQHRSFFKRFNSLFLKKR